MSYTKKVQHLGTGIKIIFIRKNWINCFSTPFDASSLDFLETLKVPLYKISSFEVTDIPLLKK